MKKNIIIVFWIIVLILLLMVLSGCTNNQINIQDNNKVTSQDDTSETLQKIRDASSVRVEEKIITLNKEYTIYIDNEEIATVSGKYVNITGDVFKLEDNNGNILAKEKQIKRWGIRLNRLAKVMDENENITGYIGEDVIKDFFSVSKYKFHFYDENKNEYAYTKEKILSLLYEFEIYDMNGNEAYKVEKDFDLLTDTYTITKVSDNDVTMDNVIFLTCIVDAIRDANE